MKVLVTGGCGYIGSHTLIQLLERHHEVAVFDNFGNAKHAVLRHISRVAGYTPVCFEADIRTFSAIVEAMQAFSPDVVIHFAALKSVAESWAKPLDYFDNNISGTIALLRAMRACQVRNLVFSSSATVYGNPLQSPVDESAPLQVTNPYARTKLVMERLIDDVCAAHDDFRAAVLRYFNPVGAHPSGELGEDPAGVPANLMPYVSQVAIGRRDHLNVFGRDYDTLDGTGVRDYIHVMDLARAHVDALDLLLTGCDSFTVNLGTGRGYSVLELVHAFEKACGRTIPLHFCARRAGDVAACYANPQLAEKLLGWRAKFNLDQMCQDAWRWQSAYPDGYASDV